MILQWKPFKIHLKSLRDYISECCPNTDGIVANEDWDYFEIVEKVDLSPEEINKIQTYYDSLTESGELEKLNYPQILSDAIINCKNFLLEKSYDSMTVAEKKLLLGIKLTKDDEMSIIQTYGNNSI